MPQEEKGEFLFVQNAFEEENKLLLFFSKKRKKFSLVPFKQSRGFPATTTQPSFPFPPPPGRDKNPR